MKKLCTRALPALLLAAALLGAGAFAEAAPPPQAAASPVVTAVQAEVRAVTGRAFTVAVEASAPDGGTLAYQWHLLDGPDVSSSNMRLIEGATGPSFTGTYSVAGSLYYCCLVTNHVEGLVDAGTMGPVIAVRLTDTPFTDVPGGAWYELYVKDLYDRGLLDGVTATRFAPDLELTRAQALKLAACLRQSHEEGAVTLDNGSPWYASYLQYALDSGVAPPDYATLTAEELNAPVSRRDFVALLYNALPAESYAAKNEIADGAVPDVPMDDPAAAQIYAFYRAGILTGFDGTGAFLPDAGIRRSAVCAIVARMCTEALREYVQLG